MWRKITGITMLVVTVGLIGWDLIVAFNGIDGDTISEIMKNYAHDYPIIPLAWGVVLGHWFWPLGSSK
jgi:hypothetical protein